MTGVAKNFVSASESTADATATPVGGAESSVVLQRPEAEDNGLGNGEEMLLPMHHLKEGSKANIESAIISARNTITMSPSDHAKHSSHQFNLALLLHKLYKIGGSLLVLEEAIGLADEATRATTPHGLGEDRFGCMYELVAMIYHKYERTGALADLRQSRDVAEKIVHEVPATHPKRAQYLDRLGAITLQVYHNTRDEREIEKSILLMEEAVHLTPFESIASENTSDLVGYLHNLTLAYYADHHRHEQSRSRADRLIEVAKKAAELSTHHHTKRADHLCLYGFIMTEAFDISKDISDIDEAIRALRQALPLKKPEDGSGHLTVLIELSSALDSRYAMLGRLPDIQEAAALTQRAAETVPMEHVYMTAIYTNLLARCSKLFRRSSVVADLDVPIQLGIWALESIPPEAVSVRNRLLHNVGSCFLDQYGTSFDIVHLEKGLDYIRQAADGFPKDDMNWGAVATSFTYGLAEHFRRTQALADLEAAIALLTEVVQLARGTLLQRSAQCYNLSMYHVMRHRRTGNQSDLQRCVELASLAMEHSQGHLTDHGRLAASLALALRDRYQVLGDRGDLERSIDLGRQAIEPARGEYFDRFSHMLDLAVALRERHIATKLLDDLDESIELTRQALVHIDDTHQSHARGLTILSYNLYLRQQIIKSPEDESQMMESLRKNIGVSERDSRNAY